MVTIALSHLLGRGVRLETHEAVALARSLMAHPCGIPTLENIQLASDGSASCISNNGMPSVASVADLLLTLLPAGASNVPAQLHYAIARGLGAVEAPPFGSLSEFSNTLARFEQGTTRDVLRGFLQRNVRPSRPSLAPTSIVVAFPTRVVPPPAIASTRRASRRWRLAFAAALVVSFTAGFAVRQGVIDRRAVKTPSRSTHVSPEPSGAPLAPNNSAANLADGKRADESLQPPRTPRVVRKVLPQPFKAVRATDAEAVSPASPSEGTAIFLHTNDRDRHSANDVARAGSQTVGDLGIMTIADDGSHNDHVQPSPDGFSVAFDSDRDGERGVYVANRDGSHVRRVSGDGYAAVPTWSPNNEWLAYIRAEADRPSVWNLWVQSAAGGTPRRVTNYESGQTWAASWFPDSRRIAYTHEDTLMVMDLQTAQATRYQTPVAGQLVRTPVVSPDGTRIVFQVLHDGTWLLDLADGSMRRVLADPTAGEFAWAPDGRRVAYYSHRDGHWGLYVLSPA